MPTPRVNPEPPERIVRRTGPGAPHPWPKYVTAEEAAKLTGLPASTIKRAPYVRIPPNRKRYYSAELIRRFAEEHSFEEPEEDPMFRELEYRGALGGTKAQENNRARNQEARKTKRRARRGDSGQRG